MLKSQKTKKALLAAGNPDFLSGVYTVASPGNPSEIDITHGNSLGELFSVDNTKALGLLMVGDIILPIKRVRHYEQNLYDWIIIHPDVGVCRALLNEESDRQLT